MMTKEEDKEEENTKRQQLSFTSTDSKIEAVK